MKKVKKNRGMEALKSRYGMMFTLPWIIGIIIFFIIPLFQSIIYSFSQVTVTSNGMKIIFKGLENYRYILFTDANYTNWLRVSFTEFLYSLPLILLLSLVLALLLNQNFRGRLFFRALYFLPVIIASGTVINLIFSTTSSEFDAIGVSSTITSNMVSVDDIAKILGIDGKIADYITTTISKIFDLAWSCGIQIILYLAGLQSVPRSLYEASRVEGATKWEEFWFITFPMLSRVTLLVTIYTMVDLITNERAWLIKQVYPKMRASIYDLTSAMLWFYFLLAGVVMAIVVLLYNKILMKRWEA